MDSELTILVKQLGNATCPEDVFGSLDGTVEARLLQLRALYRKLSRAVHPDRHGNAPEATEAFARLGQLRALAENSVNSGTYGHKPVFTAATKRHTYEMTRKSGVSGAANIYHATMDNSIEVYCHLTQAPNDNDLLRNEAVVIGKLRSPDQQAGEGYLPMIPELLDSFTVNYDGKQLQANVFASREGFVSLSEIVQAFPTGVNPRDMAWMWRRLLDVLGYAHSRGVVHGAVLPSNIYIGLGDVHEVVLANWQNSVQDPDTTNAHITTIDAAHEAWYPPEVFRKEPPLPSIDIYMSARCMLQLLGGDPLNGKVPLAVPAKIRGFLQSCLFAQPYQRPQDAWQLRKEFGQLCKELWGKHVYRPFYLTQ